MNSTGLIITLLAAIAYSTKAIFAKLAYFSGSDPETLIALRMAFAAPFYLGIFLWSLRQNRGALSTLSLKQHLQIGFLGVLSFIVSAMLDFHGLRYISADLERIIVFSYPTMTVILSALIFGVAVSKRDKGALFITYVGLIIACQADLHKGQKDVVIGSLLVLGCALTYALYLVFSERLIQKVGSLLFTSYATGVATFFLLSGIMLRNPTLLLQQTSEVYSYALAMAVFSTVLASLLMSEGVKRIGAGRAAVIGTVGPIATIYLAHIFLNESLSLQQGIGGILVVSGVITLSSSKPAL